MSTPGQRMTAVWLLKLNMKTMMTEESIKNQA